MKFKWPLVWRKKADAQYGAAIRRAIDDEQRYRREAEAKEKEWREKWSPILDKMAALSASRHGPHGFIVHVELDRFMMEQAASYNDPSIWRYVAELIGHKVERQLTTINFAGLHRLADELENRRFRPMASYNRFE